MIIYRKAPQLRVRRVSVPEPPFWAATTITPYGPRRSSPLAIDYTTLTASGVERAEVTVSSDIEDQIERLDRRQPFREPVLIDGAEMTESVFGRGADALALCGRIGHATSLLVSARGTLPGTIPDRAAVAIAAWPLDLAALDALFRAASERKCTWGVVVPVIFPVTTNLGDLAQLADLAQTHGAQFLASASIDLDATARHAIARARALGSDDDEYAMLFHAALDPINIATERHIATLAASTGAEDFVLPSNWRAKTNWNAAVVLTLTASRMIAMENDIDLASCLARSARVVATLDKAVARVAESAHLGIIEGLDDLSAEILGDWLEDRPSPFAERIHQKWRLRRDHGI